MSSQAFPLVDPVSSPARRLSAPSFTPHASPHRHIRVALAGCGTVGGALVELVHERATALAARHDTTIELTSVLVRGGIRRRPATLDPALVTTDLDEFLAAPADVVVEAIGGDGVASSIAESVLRRGRRLVTANKLLLAQAGPALLRLAREHGTTLDFEASVAGGVPVVRAIREQLAPGGIRTVRGIINGTTNYILDAMSAGRGYADALADAQRLGYAEADPTRDVSGADAADKLRILGWLAFGVAPDAITMHVRGVGPDLDDFVHDARERGSEVRLIAEVSAVDDRVRGVISPQVVPLWSPFATVRGAGNLVEVETTRGDTFQWAGPGAGGNATASAILGDILRRVPQ